MQRLTASRAILLLVASAVGTFTAQDAAAAGAGAGAGAGAFATAGSSSSGGGGATTWTSGGNVPGNAAAGPPMNFGGFVFPDSFGLAGLQNSLRMHMQQMQELLAQHQQMTYSNGVGDGYSAVGGDGTADSAHASLSLDNRGGNAEAYLVPDVNLMSRISETLPPASGGPISVFSSSSSGSHVGADGKTQSFKHASVGVNDNGKISVYTVKDPS